MRQVYACWFPSPDRHLGADREWRRLSDVLLLSLVEHCQGWFVRVESIPARPWSSTRSASHHANTEKLDTWNRVVQAADNGTELLLLDVDTFALRSLDALWDRAFDVAYTVRAGQRYPFNAGVIALRVNDRSRAFMARWAAENTRMYVDRHYHRAYHRAYGGINQASLGALLEAEDRAPTVLRTMLPCQEWNCEDTSWADFNDETRIVHLKSNLRMVLFHRSVSPALQPIVRKWKAIEALIPGSAQ